MNTKKLLENKNFRNNQNYIFSKKLIKKVKNNIINSKKYFYYRSHGKILLKNLDFNNYNFYSKIFFYTIFIIIFSIFFLYIGENKTLGIFKIISSIIIIFFSFLLLKLIYRKIFLKKYVFVKDKKFIYFFQKKKFAK